MAQGPPLQGGDGPAGGHETGLGLEQGGDVVGQTRPDGPPVAHLGAAEDLVGHPLGVHGGRVVGDRNGRVGGEEVQAAGALDHHLAGVRGQQVPGGIGLLGQGHVARRVVAEPDDPGVVLTGPPLVAQSELLEPDDRRPPPGRRPGRGAAERAEPDDDHVAVGCRGLGQRISPISGPYQRRMSALSSSMGANQPCVYTRERHPPLHPRARRPVLSVDAVPEGHGVGRVEVVPGHLRRAAKRNSPVTRVRPGPSGVRTRAAAWSADRDRRTLG